MLNEKLLKSKMMLTKYDTFNHLSEAIGIDGRTLYDKRKGKIRFNTVDIIRIKEVLNLTDDEVITIFFGGK